MKARELYRLYQTLTDSAGEAHLSPERFARLYWVSQVEWLKELARQPTTKLTRAARRPFQRQYQLAATGSGHDLRVIEYGQIDPVPLVIRAVGADFGGDRLDVPVTPADSDELRSRQLDPFRRGTDDDPLYSEEVDGQLTIHSDTAPFAVRVLYWCYPEKLDMQADSEPLEDETAQLEILRRVVAEKDLIDANYNRYQLLSGRAIPAAEQPA